jgi:thiamine biosynthesis protein ThiS
MSQSPPLPTSEAGGTLRVNGQPTPLSPGLTVEALLEQLGLRRDGVAVAVGGAVLPRSAWAGRALEADERVEIIQAVGGG